MMIAVMPNAVAVVTVVVSIAVNAEEKADAKRSVAGRAAASFSWSGSG